MEFTDGNQLWKMRSKHGRDRLFKTPEALWEAACGYFKWCDEHPIYKAIPHKSMEQPFVCIPKVRAYTLKGLCIYLGCGSKYFNHFEAQMAGKTDEVSEEFMYIISMIRDVIFEQKFTAAAAGELNPSIIAREMNLAYNPETAENKPVEPIKEKQKIKWGDMEIEI